ncbi:MAG: trigger factor [Patescibacteria group bacterium]
MKTNVEKLKKSKIKLTVVVEPAEMAKHFREAYQHLAEGVKITGFRPGKAPRKMIEESIGVTRILTHALDHAFQEHYVIALNRESIYPVAEPKIVVNKYPTYGLSEDDVREGFEFEAEVEVFPETALGDLSKLKVDSGKPEDVKAADIDKIIDHLRRQKAGFREIDREAKMGDFVEVDFEGRQKGVKIDQMCSQHHPLVLGEGGLIPGFEEKIVGIKKNEEKKFKTTFPRDYHVKEYAGTEAEFTVKLNVLKEVALPELGDEFAKEFGHPDMEKLRAAVSQNLKHELEHKYQHELEEKVIGKVLPLLKVELPEGLVQRETDRIVKGMEKQVAASGLDFETYLTSMKKTPADIAKEMQPQAEKNVKIGLLLGQIIKDKKIDPNDKEAGKKALDFLVEQLTKK